MENNDSFEQNKVMSNVGQEPKWEKIIDFTEIKKDGVNINELLRQL